MSKPTFQPSQQSAAPSPRPPYPLCRIAILGSTGSIGTQSLNTIAHLNTLHDQGHHPTRYEVVALSANSNTTELAKQSRAHPNALIGLCNPNTNPADLQNSNLIHHQNASATLIENTAPDLVIGAIVGIAGLSSTLKAAQLGIDIALANKESLVAGGSLVTNAALTSGAKILPVDSEHAGLWQCLLGLTNPNYAPPSQVPSDSIRRVVLTASGGPFYNQTLQQINNATIKQALNHPTWTMGAKVSIDSASLMNKALELIEAHWLFGLSADQLDAVIHPQSTIHAFLETVDGSVISHLGPTDMRCPIQHALTHPLRSPSQSKPLDLTSLGTLQFTKVDPIRFPAINMAKAVINAGGSAGTIFNAANEAAVDAFLNKQINFGAITSIVQQTLEQFDHQPVDSLESVLDIHQQSCAAASKLIATHAQPTP